MSFFQTVSNSVWGPVFYRAKADNPRGAFSYYFKLALILAVITTAAFCLGAGPRIAQTLRAFPDQVTAYYPDDLVITINNGQVSVNQPLPYALSLPEGMRTPNPKETDPVNLVVFDTESTFTVESFRAARTIAFVTKDAIVFENDNQLRVLPVDRLACESGQPCTYTITNEKVASFMADIQPFAAYILPFMAVGMLILLMLSYVATLIGMLLIALATMLVLRALKTPPMRLRYGVVYRLCLYGATLPLIADAVVMVLRTFLGTGVPYVGSFLVNLIVIATIVTLNLRAGSSHIVPDEAPQIPAQQ